ncbi:MAG: lipid-A-disaccharide synthase [Pseudomonadales bacterium]|jgi:lipid-A-disaccharide synthase|nr:lipid-A-disaccharide synthase [Pseudomonadales bacterium]
MRAGPRIGLLAGEASGDALGAALQRALRARHPDASFVGVGGAAMRAEGLQAFHGSEALAVNGLVDPLRRLPTFWRLLRGLERDLGAARLDAFVGIDFNVFNLLLERRLRRLGLPVAHFVSPSVYAWRAGRVRTVAASADRLLTLFPFEAPYYDGTGLEVVHVGHPLADELRPTADRAALRRRLGLDASAGPLLALLPGSRASEIALHAAPFVAAARRLAARLPGLEAVVAVLDEEAERGLRRSACGAVRCIRGRTREVLAAADLALVKAGTGTLEAMLVGTPMVVAYRLGSVTHALLERLVHAPHFALPNLLAGRALVPELIQDAMTPDALAAALAEVHGAAHVQRAAFAELAATLCRGAAARAADAVLELAGRRPS